MTFAKLPILFFLLVSLSAKGEAAPWFDARCGYSIGETVGIDCPYGNLGGLLVLPFPSNRRAFFFEGNGYLIERGTWDGNVGGGIRVASPSCYFGAGLTAYYDYRQGCLGSHHQYTVGAEAVFGYNFIYATVYLPFDKKQEFCDPTIFDDYIGNFRASAQCTGFSYRGFNIDFGRTFYLLNWLEFQPTVGPYYFSGPFSRTWGTRATALVRLFDRMNFEFQFTHDPDFETRYAGFFYLNLPFRFFYLKTACAQFYRRPTRLRILPASCCCAYEWNWQD